MTTVTQKAVQGVSDQAATNVAATFAPATGRRLLIFGGMALIAGGMFFGDIFAVFLLHQNGAQTGNDLLAATQAVSVGNAPAIRDIFASIGGLLEDRGTKVDTHVHMTDAGYLALLLALTQPYIALSQQRKKLLARLFIAGGALLPVGIFLIHYVGLAHSPFPVIGWGSVVADSAGALMVVALIGQAWGLLNHLRGGIAENEPELPRDRTWESRTLLTGGTILVLLGFLYGAWYARIDLYSHEARETHILNTMLDGAINNQESSGAAIHEYGSLAAERAVKIAAHSHVIEFGLLAILLSFVQPYVYLSAAWKRRWVAVLLAGSVILPAFVLLELKLGLLAGGIADVGGLLVIVALCGMLVGVLRFGGHRDAHAGSMAGEIR